MLLSRLGLFQALVRDSTPKIDPHKMPKPILKRRQNSSTAATDLVKRNTSITFASKELTREFSSEEDESFASLPPSRRKSRRSKKRYSRSRDEEKNGESSDNEDSSNEDESKEESRRGSKRKKKE